MKKIIILMAILIMLSAMPMAFASGDGGSTGGIVEVEEFPPMVFQCGGRVIADDAVQPGRITGDDVEMSERNQQYLFEGEKYQVDVLVFDKNKIQEDIVDLVLEGENRCSYSCGNICKDAADRTVSSYTDEAACKADGICTLPGYTQTQCTTNPTLVWINGICTSPSYTDSASCTAATGTWLLNDWEQTCLSDCEQIQGKITNCFPTTLTDITPCNAKIGEEPAMTTFDSKTMQAYRCTIDVLDSEHMYGLYQLKVRAESGLTGEEGEYAEVARWFINPIISLSVDGDLDFSDVRPGTASYSTVLLENTAEGGVLLDMFIAGKDWPAAGTELGKCWDGATYRNYLPLSAFRYYAENGAYSTRNDFHINGAYSSVVRNVDSEGYVNINQQVSDGFTTAMFNDAEIIQANPLGAYWDANILYPGSAGMSVTFKLTLPEPCYGEYESPSDGSIFFWGEAI